MQGLPKQPDPTRLGSSVAIRVQSMDRGDCAEPVEVSVPQQEVNSRRFRIVPNKLTAHGYTPGCTGCRHKRAGFTTARDHSEACRKRISDAINSDSWQFQERVRQTTHEETTLGDQEIVDHVDAVGAVEPSTDVHWVEVFSPPRVSVGWNRDGLGSFECTLFNILQNLN